MPAAPGRRLYACADGEFVSVAAAEPRTWAALCATLELPDLVDDLHPQGQRAARVTERLAGVFRTRPAREWVELLGPAGAAVGPVNQGRAVQDDPHNRARGVFVEVAGVQVPGNPIRSGGGTATSWSTASSAPPRGDQHTGEVLAAAGFTLEEIRRLRETGVV
jgi:crotonobetainyl-CoA:carnitine CoA-transferase CaiB-like acyl-CoA transferase